MNSNGIGTVEDVRVEEAFEKIGKLLETRTINEIAGWALLGMPDSGISSFGLDGTSASDAAAVFSRVLLYMPDLDHPQVFILIRGIMALKLSNPDKIAVFEFVCQEAVGAYLHLKFLNFGKMLYDQLPQINNDDFLSAIDSRTQSIQGLSPASLATFKAAWLATSNRRLRQSLRSAYIEACKS